MILSYEKDHLRNKNEFILSKATAGVMVSVIHSILRRVEVGTWIEDQVKEGYTKGSWQHIKQSDKILIKAWKVKSK